MNSINITGRLTKDIDLISTNDGKQIANFSIANEWFTKTDFYGVTAFGKQAEYLTRYARKGDMLIISGHLQVNKWEDKNGSKHNRVDIICDMVSTLPSNKNKKETVPEETNDFADLSSDEELPF